MLSMDTTDPKPRVFLKGDFNAEGADFSRDGRYVAYLAETTGQREIYIRHDSKPGGQVTVSVGGGREPVWANNGDLFYRSLPFYISSTGSPRPQYDVTPDGQRFLLLTSAPGTNALVARPRMVVVQNWFDELKRRVPTR